MKIFFLAFSFLLATHTHAFEIRYKMVSFGTPIDAAFNDLSPLQDTLKLRSLMDSLGATTRCIDHHYSALRKCDVRGQTWPAETDYNCCLIKALGPRVDSLNRAMQWDVSTYRSLDEVRKTLQISDSVLIRKKEYRTMLYFNTQSLFYGYIVYGPRRLPGDSGVLNDLEPLYQFLQGKYGKPDVKNENPVPPSNAGEKFEYAVWRQQNCVLKVSLVCDGTQMWLQESVLDEKYK